MFCPAAGTRQRRIPCDRRWALSRQFRPERTPWARGRRSRLPQRRPRLHLLRQQHRLARSCREGRRSVATAWPTDGQNALAGGERQSGFRRPGKAAGVAERSRQRLGCHPRQSAGHAINLLPTGSRHRPRHRRAVGPGEPVQRVHRQPPDRARDDSGGRRQRRPAAGRATSLDQYAGFPARLRHPRHGRHGQCPRRTVGNARRRQVMAELWQGSQRPEPDAGDRARRRHLRVSHGHPERPRHGGKTAAAGRRAGHLDRHRPDPAGGTHHAGPTGHRPRRRQVVHRLGSQRQSRTGRKADFSFL